MLKQEFGLTDAQIEYIACCAELHYELGIVREMAKKSDLGYTLAFAHSTAFHEHAEQLMVRYPDFQLEVGVLFLADSLAKTDTRIESGSDEQIGDQGPVITELLKKRNLNPKLINAVKQLPINRTVAETYLKIWAAAH